MLYKKVKNIFFLKCLLFTSFCFAAETESPEESFLLNLATDQNREVNAIRSGVIEITIYNMLPARPDAYVIPLERSDREVPELTNPLDNKAVGSGSVSDQSTIIVFDSNNTFITVEVEEARLFDCDELYEKVQIVENLANENQVPNAMAELNDVAQSARSQEASTENSVCGTSTLYPLISGTFLRNWLSKIKQFNENRNRTLTTTIRRNELLRVSVLRDNFESTLLVNGPQKLFYSHVGFSFIRDKSNAFYSEKVDGDENSQATYVISQQTDRKDWTQGASALFTFPITTFGKDKGQDWELGLTAGLGTDTESVAAILGASLIVHSNILIMAGASFQEFDELNGIYEIGQNVGENAIDSSALSEKTFKPSFNFTIGFRFGGND